MTKLDELIELQHPGHAAARKGVSPRISISLKSILVSTDLRGRAKKAVNYAVTLAEHFDGHPASQ